MIDGQIVDSHGRIIPDAPYTVLHLSVRPFNVLAREQNKIKAEDHDSLMISDLLKLTVEQLAAIRNMGAKSFPEIIQEIEKYLEKPEPPVGAETPPELPAPATIFAPEYETVGRVIRHKQSCAVVTNVPVQLLCLNTRNQAALLTNGYQTISDLVQVDFRFFREKTGLGRKAAREVSDKLDEYLALHQEYYGQDASAEVIVTPEIIMEFFGQHEFEVLSKEKLMSEFDGADEKALNIILDRLVNEGIIIQNDKMYHKYHRSFFQYAFTTAGADYPKLKSDSLEVLRWRSLGSTLEEVGQSRGTTRERVRQIEKRTFDILTKKEKSVLLKMPMHICLQRMRLTEISLSRH